MTADKAKAVIRGIIAANHAGLRTYKAAFFSAARRAWNKNAWRGIRHVLLEDEDDFLRVMDYENTWVRVFPVLKELQAGDPPWRDSRGLRDFLVDCGFSASALVTRSSDNRDLVLVITIEDKPGITCITTLCRPIVFDFDLQEITKKFSRPGTLYWSEADAAAQVVVKDKKRSGKKESRKAVRAAIAGSAAVVQNGVIIADSRELFGSLRCTTSDQQYRCVTEEVFMQAVDFLRIHKRKYVADFYDCDKFARALWAQMPVLGITGVAIVYDKSSRHAYNAVRLSTGVVRGFEPQSGKFIKIGTGDHKAKTGEIWW